MTVSEAHGRRHKLEGDGTDIDTRKIFDGWSMFPKGVAELNVVDELFNALGLNEHSAKSIASNDPPDCVAEIDGTMVGLEVRRIISEEARRESAKSEMKGGSGFSYIWTKETFREAIIAAIQEKEVKIGKGISARKTAIECSSFWLVLHSSEMFLLTANVEEYLANWTGNSSVFDRVYLILDYDPGCKSYPAFRIK